MKKYNFLNIWRLVMALFVVANHIHPIDSFIENNNYLYNFYNFIIPFAVPFFFLSTGFFIGKKINNIENMQQKDYDIIKQLLLKVLKLYVIFTIIYLPITAYGFWQSGTSIIKSLIIFIRNFVLIGENFNSWILWYLLSEIYGLLLIYLLKNKVKNNKIFIYIGVILFLFGIAIDYFNEYSFDTQIFILLQKIIQNIIRSGRIFYSSLFIPLGIYISKNEKVKNKLLSLTILVVILGINTLFNIMFIRKISLVICSYIIFTFVIHINIKNYKIANYCKQASVDFYFWHLYVYSIITLLIDGSISQNYGLKYYVLTVIILLIFTTIHYLYKKKKYY